MLFRNMLVFYLLLIVSKGYTQDTLNLQYIIFSSSLSGGMPFNYLYQFPDKSDSTNIVKYDFLASQQPTLENHKEYYLVACSFWEMNKLRKAKKMFLNIIESKEPYYTNTLYHSSGTTYGYGSFSSNYKNEASIMLTKIYIKQQKFKEALQHLNNAVEKYEVSYGCGTGAYMQQEELDFLYGMCYEGLKLYAKTLDLLLPNALERDDEISRRILKRLYNSKKIKTELDKSEKSIEFAVDSVTSYSIKYSGSSRDTLVYYGGQAHIQLFGRKVKIPQPTLEHGEVITKEKFLAAFRKIAFYYYLTKED